jgi:hypothetical protein
MIHGRPSSTAPPSGEEKLRLEDARAELRDALGSVRNLAQLLRSVRVGPRAIRAVLPAVHGPCGRLEESVRVLLEVVAVRLPDRAAVDELIEYIAPRAKELEAALASAMSRPLGAKTRLALENVVGRLSRELEAARALVELLDDSVRGSAVRLELSELLREAAESEPIASARPLSVRVESQLRGDVTVNPRVAIALLGVGARLVADAGATPLIAGGSEGDRELRIAPEGGAGNTVQLPALPVIAPTLACARAAAQVSGAHLRWDQQTHHFSLVWEARSART